MTQVKKNGKTMLSLGRQRFAMFFCLHFAPQFGEQHQNSAFSKAAKTRMRTLMELL